MTHREVITTWTSARVTINKMVDWIGWQRLHVISLVAVVIATGLVLTNLASGWVVSDGGGRSLDVAGYCLAAMVVLALGLWRNAPGIGLGISAVATLSYALAGYPVHPGQSSMFVALYFFARSTPRGLAAVAASVALVSVCIGGLLLRMVDSTTIERLGLAGLFILPVAPVLVARVGHANDARRSELVARLAATESAKNAEAERLLIEQRLAIARDLHDTVAQSVAAVAVQSGAALAVFDTDPQAARQGLAAIRDASRAVITDTKSTLESLREHEPMSAPTLVATAASARSAGLDVTLRDATGQHTPPMVRYALQRIAQESVSNVLRHSDADQIDIELRVADGLATLVVIDNGTAAEQPPTAGHGLIGMAERVALLDGQIRTGPRPAGGFEVRAVVPVGGVSS